MPDEKTLREVVSFVEERELQIHLTDLQSKRVLEVAPGQTSLAGLIQKKGAGFVAVLGGTREREISPHTHFVVSRWETFPFLNETWDRVVARIPFLKGAAGRLVTEVARVLKPDGRATVSAFHPFSLLLSRAREEGGTAGEGIGFERTLRLFHDAGLLLESVHEVFFDGTLKKFFVSKGSGKTFELLKKTPLLIFFRVKKGER